MTTRPRHRLFSPRHWLTGLCLLPGLGMGSPTSAEEAPRHPSIKGCELPPATACLAALDARALPGSGWRREGPRLLSPQGQAWVDGEGGVQRWLYLGPLAGTELHLLARRDGEALRYQLVGPGALPQALDDLPWPAPGGRLMVVAAPATPQGSVSLLGKVGPQWRVLWRLDASDGLGFGFRQWRADGAAVRLDWSCADGSAAGFTQLRDGPYGWDLTPGTPGCR